MADSSPESIERELYESADRPAHARDAPHAVPRSARRCADGPRRRLARRRRARATTDAEDADRRRHRLPIPPRTLAELEEIALAAMREHGEVSTTELRGDRSPAGRADHAGAREELRGLMAVDSRVVHHLALDGRIGRGRPRGSWIGGQFRWSPIERWFPEGIPRCRSTRHAPSSCAAGSAPSARHARRRALVDRLDGRSHAHRARRDRRRRGRARRWRDGYVLPDDLEPVQAPAPWVALLPALDATTMGWTGRDWYLGPHGRGCSTRMATPARRSGSTVASSAAGRSFAVARSCRCCSRTWASRRRSGSRPRRPGSRPGSGRLASRAASRRHSRSASRVAALESFHESKGRPPRRGQDAPAL